MNEFFAPAIPAESIMSDRLRIRLVDGDGMEPTLHRSDYVFIAPVDAYQGEGVYLLDIGGGVALYRARSSFQKRTPIRLTLDNPLYRTAHTEGYLWTRTEFDDAVLGIVCADVKIRDPRFLRQAVENKNSGDN